MTRAPSRFLDGAPPELQEEPGTPAPVPGRTERSIPTNGQEAWGSVQWRSGEGFLHLGPEAPLLSPARHPPEEPPPAP